MGVERIFAEGAKRNLNIPTTTHDSRFIVKSRWAEGPIFHSIPKPMSACKF